VEDCWTLFDSLFGAGGSISMSISIVELSKSIVLLIRDVEARGNVEQCTQPDNEAHQQCA